MTVFQQLVNESRRLSGRELILRDKLREDPPEWDLVIDCPPSRGVLTLDALAAVGGRQTGRRGKTVKSPTVISLFTALHSCPCCSGFRGWNDGL